MTQFSINFLKEKVLFASSNRHKFFEFSEILSKQKGFSLDLLSKNLSIDETGLTFKENAFIKAQAYAKEYNRISFSDDSGLVIDVLNGEPGIYSARYAGDQSSSEDLINKVLEKLKNIDIEKIQARYVAAVCLYIPKNILNNNEIVVYNAIGTCEGQIVKNKKGLNGFGYDPIFMPDGYNVNMAELNILEKNKISHRFNAVMKLLESIPVI